jgi:hypothetical protein
MIEATRRRDPVTRLRFCNCLAAFCTSAPSTNSYFPFSTRYGKRLAGEFPRLPSREAGPVFPLDTIP